MNATATPASTPSNGRGWAVSGAIVAIACIAWAAFQFVTVLAHDTIHTTLTFPAARIDALRVRSDDGNVRVVTTTESEITVEVRVDEGLRAPRHHERVEGSALRLDAGCPGFATMWCAVSYVVHLPTGIVVDASSDNGDITVDDATANVRAVTANGEVDVSVAAGVDQVIATSDNGDVTVAIPDDTLAWNVQASTSNGDRSANVRIDPTSPRTIDATSDNGDVTVRYR